MIILNISGTRAILTLFYVQQDTASEKLDMYISVDLPIFTQKYIKGYMGQRFP